MKTKILLKENNAGGLQLEAYQKGEIHSVITGLECAEKASGVLDIVSYGDAWDWTDVGAEIEGYSVLGNSGNYKDPETGKILTAKDVIDNHDTTVVVAEYDGKDLVLHAGVMGGAAQAYFGIE